MHPFSGSQLKVCINKTREYTKQADRNAIRRGYETEEKQSEGSQGACTTDTAQRAPRRGGRPGGGGVRAPAAWLSGSWKSTRPSEITDEETKATQYLTPE